MRRSAADCVSLQPRCSPETHWAAARGLLAGQVIENHFGFLEIFVSAPVTGENFLAFDFQSYFLNVLKVAFCLSFAL